MRRAQLLPFLLMTSALAFTLAAKEAWLPKSAGPPACFAGEPPRGSTCNTSGCHTDFAVNSGAASLMLDLDGAETGYFPGQTYSVEVALHLPGLVRGGFQAIALQDNDDTLSPGTFTLTDILRTQRVDRNFPHADTGCSIYSKVWIEHTDFGIDDPVSDTIRWAFDWQAPPQDVGSITFYVAAVEANADLDPSGDHVYSLEHSISSLVTSLTPQTASLQVDLFPQPTSDLLQIRLGSGNSATVDWLSIHDLTGRCLMESPGAPILSIASLPSGTYLLRVEAAEATRVLRIVKK